MAHYGGHVKFRMRFMCLELVKVFWSYEFLRHWYINNMWNYSTKVNVLVTQLCWLFATPWTVALQAPITVGFSRKEYWSGYSLLQGIFSNQGWTQISRIAGRVFTVWVIREWKQYRDNIYNYSNKTIIKCYSFYIIVYCMYIK